MSDSKRSIGGKCHYPDAFLLTRDNADFYFVGITRKVRLICLSPGCAFDSNGSRY